MLPQPRTKQEQALSTDNQATARAHMGTERVTRG
jgi:hypothetical protein